MRVACSSSLELRPEWLARALGALAASLLCGCALQITSDTCDKPRTFLSADTKVVMAPLTGLPKDSPEGARIGGLIQAASAASGGDYDSVKVIRLQPRADDDASCTPDRIRMTWSGCTHGSPVLIGGEPVTVIWSGAHETNSDLFVQFGMSNWMIGGSYDIALHMRTPGGASYTLVATVPIEDVAFVPRRISMERLMKIGEAFGCRLFDAPSASATWRPVADCGNAFDGEIVDRARENGRPWYKVALRNGHQGWMPSPPMSEVTQVFPEFALVGMAVTYQQFLKTLNLYALRQENHRAINRAFDEFRGMKPNDDTRAAIGVAELIMGSADLLQGAKRRNPGLLKTSAVHFATASQYVSYQSDAANLYLLADLLACCEQHIGDVSINEIESTGRLPSRDQIESHALKMKAFLLRDPANTRTLANLVALLTMMRDEGYDKFGDYSVRDELEAVLPAFAARRVTAARAWTCEALTQRQAALAR